MNEAFIIDREFLFKTNIHEIISISIEHNYDIDGSNVEGEFIISGDYRLHEISINKEDFSFKIPFTHEIEDSINLDTIEVEISDFSYEFNNEDELSVHIEYIISGEKNLIEFDNQEDLKEFLDENKAEIVDLSDTEVDNSSQEERQNDISDLIDEFDNPADSNNEIEMPKENSDIVNEDMIINNATYEDAFVKYHVHTVTMNDTIESICSKYNINLNTLKKYNSFDNLELNMKLLIPENEEN